jgi:hypothetical protein
MNLTKQLFLVMLFFGFAVVAQENETTDRKPGHTNENKFKQLKDELATPNAYHTASGKPGPLYTQQKVDYTMDIILDDENQRLYGNEAIVYHNNSQDNLEYLWIQLEQNKRALDSKSPDIEGDGVSAYYEPISYSEEFLKTPFDGGFKLQEVKDSKGKDLKYTVNRTMMRLELPKPLKTGDKFEFSIKWWYNINEHTVDRARSGFEHFKEDGNNLYVIAQFFPRLAVYNNVEGWQNMQFWGRSEFALEFGDYKVNITAPADHVLNATGVLTNAKKVLSTLQYERFNKAKKSFDKPVFIVTQEEAEAAEKQFSKATKTWSFDAKSVRDFAFASSRKFIWDAMAVDINGKTVMAYSLYPKEGNPLWEEFSTKVVAHTLKTYSKFTFDYPYHKAISVHSKRQGMEYPQICWNYGRPKKDGTYSKRVRDGMIGVITHEIGHNFFPMIVNSDERQWTWMDEGLNSFLETLTELEFESDFNTGNLPKDIVKYMADDQDYLSPIMTQGDNVHQFGPNAYTKPAAGLYMLRETIMGHELFDYAFQTYSKRWMFKHPTPEDFFRTMEDASAVDLDWFWRGWFYTTDYSDIGVKEVKSYRLTNKPTQKMLDLLKKYNVDISNVPPMVYLSNEPISEGEPESIGDIKELESFVKDAEVEAPKYYYEVTFNKPGGLVLPIIAEYTYEDGTKERKVYPAQIWRKNDKEVSKLITSNKKLVSIQVDPDLETADIDTSNNSWPKKEEKSKFDTFKEKQ